MSRRKKGLSKIFIVVHGKKLQMLYTIFLQSLWNDAPIYSTHTQKKWSFYLPLYSTPPGRKFLCAESSYYTFCDSFRDIEWYYKALQLYLQKRSRTWAFLLPSMLSFRPTLQIWMFYRREISSARCISKKV
uniref:PA137R n=1 Tax=African swine fever virus TaxID=10497 RepID=A0A6G7KUG8_ASF